MKRSAIPPVVWFLTFLWGATWGVPQTGQGVPQSNQQVLQVTTHLVVVNVVVHDKKGAPVAGLTRDDFKVFDGGKEETISVFSVEQRGAPQGPLEPLPLNVFSNRIARQGGTPTSVAVILLGGSGTRFEDLAYARQQLIKFLSQLQPQDRVALYALRRRLSIIQDFTSDPSPLVEAIRQYQQPAAGSSGTGGQGEASDVARQGSSGSTALAATRLDAALFDLVHTRGTEYRDLDTLEALAAIAHHLSGLPGRKSLIWLTGAVPFPGPSSVQFGPIGGSNLLVEDKVRKAILALNQADVALYIVDARGLFTDPAFDAANSVREPYEQGAYGSALNGMTFETQAMIYWANETGGRSYHNTNDLTSAIRRALDDSEITYTLGYYPSHGKWDGQYRSIKVRVNTPGVEVRHRQGYFASPATQVSVAKKDRMAMLKEAALNPLEATGVGLTVRVRPFRGANGGYKLEVNVSPNLNDLRFQQVNGRWTGLLDVLVGQYSKQGRSLGGTTKTLSESMTNATYQEVMRKGLTIGFYQDVVRSEEEVRVVVRDGLTGSTGSVKIPLHR